MGAPRIYISDVLETGAEVSLDDQALRHTVKVLRLSVGDPIVLFNGTGGQYEARLTVVEKRRARALVERFDPKDTESPLRVTLAQGVAKGERMDFAIQKAVELGVASVVPVFTARSVVTLAGDRLSKRLRHWRRIAASACEQCGRNRIPDILPPVSLHQLLAGDFRAGPGLVLAPDGDCRLRDIAATEKGFTLLIGPEGGLSDAELGDALAAGFIGITLGPRILRTETAGIAALTALQTLHGDL